ncbi:MAG: hypothetical protein CMK09_04095 [Ponticaulis sp.]|nr:hypothetical protein [Ponticaulis sp.]|tara:strand:- start:33626 stop:33904 length:279 start_codon:yes stop_codon:yes gene_type:complete
MAYTDRLNATGKAMLMAGALTLPLAACGGDNTPTVPTLDSPEAPETAIEDPTPTPEITPTAEPTFDPDTLSDDGLGEPEEVDPYLDEEDLPE